MATPLVKKSYTVSKKPRLVSRPKNDELSLNLIPTKNGVQVIDNFSLYSDFVIEGDKLYRSDKGKSRWKELKDDELLYKILKFLKDNYNFTGYLDNESEVYKLLHDKFGPKKVLPNTEQYKNVKGQWYRLTLDGKSWFKVDFDSKTGRFSWRLPDGKIVKSAKKFLIKRKENKETNKAKLVSKKPIGLVTNPSITGASTTPISVDQLKIDNPGDLGTVWNYLLEGNIKDAFKLSYNGVVRKLHQHLGNSEGVSSLPLGKPTELPSKYNLRPLSETGDTIKDFLGKIIDDLYLIPESLLMSLYRLASRNRDDLTPLNTEGAIITAFGNFLPYGKHETKYKTFIGIDPEGHLKVGDISNFKEGDLLSGTFSNDIKSIMRKPNGDFVTHVVKTYPKYDYPAYTLWNNGNPIDMPEGRALNIFLLKGDVKGQTYGEITGGRVLVKVGDELRLLSGSLSNINEQFEEMKKRNNAEYGTFYTIDNGSYNKALRTSSQHLTSEQLHDYDMQNSSSGGNFLYITGRFPERLLFRSDTVWTPNIRTRNDESYHKGHKLENERKGILLHHTGFMDDPDLSQVTDWLTRKNGESAHVIIGEDGTRKVLARPDQVTFHAGLSIWNNRDNVNDFMIGIEFQGDTNKKDLTPQLIQSAVEYMTPIIRENNIRLEDITTHLLVRDLYNDYASRNGYKTAASKPDINEANYQKIIGALLEQVYYEK